MVLVGFWTYTCINWLRQLPYLRAWAGQYSGQGLMVVGVHTPEFSFEHDAGNIRRAVQDMAIDYPVALDDKYAVWGAFANHYWPALYFADAQGRIRHHHFGEGEYQQSEMIIQRLLAEAGSGGAGNNLVSPEARGVEAPADWASLRSPENYTGYERTENFASPGDLVPGRPHVYEAPAQLRLNHWALSGDWTAGDEAATADTAGGQIACRFHARDLNMVLSPETPGTAVRFQVLLDGQPPGDDHGTDVDGQGRGTVTEPRLYQLIRQTARHRAHLPDHLHRPRHPGLRVHLRLDRGQVAASGEAEYRFPRRKGQDGSGRDQERIVRFIRTRSIQASVMTRMGPSSGKSGASCSRSMPPRAGDYSRSILRSPCAGVHHSTTSIVAFSLRCVCTTSAMSA